MIFVTVGTHTQPFDRLVVSVDNLIGENKVKEKVIMQIGNTNYKPKNCEWKRFLSPQEFLEMNKKARIIITHGGEGCIATALKLNKPTIVVPRLKKFNEHMNDHQLDLASALEKENKIILILDVDDLEYAIGKTKHKKIKTMPSNERIIKIIEEFIQKH